MRRLAVSLAVLTLFAAAACTSSGVSGEGVATPANTKAAIEPAPSPDASQQARLLAQLASLQVAGSARTVVRHASVVCQQIQVGDDATRLAARQFDVSTATAAKIVADIKSSFCP